jgi:hypothetical protein
VNPADYRATDRAFLERVQSYAESPEAFRTRWAFRFRWSSWLVVGLFLLPLAWIAWRFGDVHIALKGVVAVMALIAVAPLVRDFRRPQCRLCEGEPERVRVQKQDGDEFLVTVCHPCHVLKVDEADSSPLPL